MRKINPVIYTSEAPGSFFRESDWKSLPQLNLPVVIILKTDQFGDKELTRLGSFLSEKEIAESRRFQFLHNKISYIVVHGLLRWMLGRYLGIPPKAIEFTYGLSGKPYLYGYSRRMFFNLSHSSGLSVLAFDPEYEIGVDVEKIDEEFDYEPIVKLFFTKKEGRYIRKTKEEWRERFYEIWTRKEAYLKAIGVGITENLNVEVLKERMKGNVLKEKKNIQMDFLFKSIIYEKNFRITLAMSTCSSNIRIFVLGNNENKVKIT